jgi:hypothetical protein
MAFLMTFLLQSCPLKQVYEQFSAIGFVHEAIVARNITEDYFERHLKPLPPGK